MNVRLKVVVSLQLYLRAVAIENDIQAAALKIRWCFFNITHARNSPHTKKTLLKSVASMRTNHFTRNENKEEAKHAFRFPFKDKLSREGSRN